jgi:hypothetical protein
MTTHFIFWGVSFCTGLDIMNDFKLVYFMSWKGIKERETYLARGMKDFREGMRD